MIVNRNSIPPNLEEAQQLLTDLLEEVTRQSADLAGGQAEELARGKTAVQCLKETTVTFGDPRSRLIPLTTEGFESQGVELNYQTRQLMNQFDFYSLVLSVNPRPQENVIISRLECKINFHSEGNEAPIVHRLCPDSEWQWIVKSGVEISLGLDANLDIQVGVDAADLSKLVNLPQYNEFKANVGTKDRFNAFTVLEGLKYQLGTFELFAQGKDCSECFWRIEKPKLLGRSQIEFNLILKVPKGWEAIAFTGEVWIEPDVDWWNRELGDAIDALPGYLKDKFGSERSIARSFAVGQKEEWVGRHQIVLPRG